MNFVGHAYIAKNNPELIAGNFAGDSYKGHLSKFSFLPQHILNGIKLHRFIDDFTDSSELIKAIGKIFQTNDIRKVTYIGTDILLDHYITKNWSLYSDVPFERFVQNVYSETDKNLIYLEEEFCFMYKMLKAEKWLFQYATEEGIDLILWQFSRRIGFKNDLTKCMSVYLQNNTEIDQLFGEFMRSIVENSVTYISNLID